MGVVKGVGISVLLMLTITLALSAQDSSVLLEKAIYTEETLGNPSEAIDLYKQIVNAGNLSQATKALALYRLGMCYRKNDSEAQALATFSTLARLYPEQKDLIAKSQILAVRPEPWVDGEVMRLTQKPIGTKVASGNVGTYRAELTQEGGRSVWNLRYYMPGNYYSATRVDAGTMIPIANRAISRRTDLEARYGLDKIEILNLKDNSQPPKQISLTGTVYDAWQIVPLLRRLPLMEGFQIVIPLFESSTGSFAKAKFEVVDRETINAPAGSFNCYKIVMTSNDNAPADQIFWISADSHAYLVKTHINGIHEFELMSIGVLDKNQPLRVGNSLIEISLPAPSQWFPIPYGSSDYLALSAPELNSSLNVSVSEYNKLEIMSIAQMIDKNIFITNAAGLEKVRPQTRESVAIAGLTGERYIADASDFESGESIVVYKYCLFSSTRQYQFTFQTTKDNFDKMKPVFESILSSLRIQ